MQIALVTETFPPDINGVALTLERLRGGLESKGHQVSLVRPGGGAEGSGENPRELQVLSLPVPGYPELRFGLPSWARLWRAWTKRRPDVVYVATEGPLGYAAARLARWLGIPVASGFHTNFPDYLRARSLPGLGRWSLRYLRRLHNGTSLTLAPSRDVARRLQGSGFHNIELLSRGVDVSLFSPARRDEALRAGWGCREANDVVYLLVGRLAPEKNLPLALESLEMLARRGGSFRCVVVGDGPDRGALQRRFRFAHFAGSLRGETLARHYASADVLLFPSLTETFGNVLLEGLASGLLTLSFDYAAAGEHVVDGVNGWKVPFGKTQDFARRVTAALNLPPPARLALGHAARATAEGLGWEVIVSRFERLLVSTSRVSLPPPQTQT